MRLYDYSSHYLALEEKLENGEIDHETFQDTLESFEDGAKEKVENTAKMVDNFKGKIRMIKEEEKTLKEKRKALENSLDWLEGNLETFLQATGKEKYEAGLYTLTYKRNPPSVNIEDENVIPEAYREPQPDKVLKREILKALKDDEEVPGVTLVTDKKSFQLKK